MREECGRVGSSLEHALSKGETVAKNKHWGVHVCHYAVSYVLKDEIWDVTGDSEVPREPIHIPWWRSQNRLPWLPWTLSAMATGTLPFLGCTRLCTSFNFTPDMNNIFMSSSETSAHPQGLSSDLGAVMNPLLLLRPKLAFFLAFLSPSVSAISGHQLRKRQFQGNSKRLPVKYKGTLNVSPTTR